MSKISAAEIRKYARDKGVDLDQGAARVAKELKIPIEQVIEAREQNAAKAAGEIVDAGTEGSTAFELSDPLAPAEGKPFASSPLGVRVGGRDILEKDRWLSRLAKFGVLGMALGTVPMVTTLPGAAAAQVAPGQEAGQEGEATEPLSYFDGEQPQVYQLQNGEKISNLPDPAPMKKHRGKKRRLEGKLVRNEINPDMFIQGDAHNCVPIQFLATAARFKASLVDEMVDELPNGNFRVYFHDRATGQRIHRDVDKEFYTSLPRKAKYARAGGRRVSKRDLMGPVIVKAYAKWKGGHENIGQGNQATVVAEEFFGIPYMFVSTANISADHAWEMITESIDKKEITSALSRSDLSAFKMARAGLLKWHAYSVMGYSEANGERQILLRNPWGHVEPAGDGKNDGWFLLDLDTFLEYFRGVTKPGSIGSTSSH